MKTQLLKWLQCPTCFTELSLERVDAHQEDDIEEGVLVCRCSYRYPVIRGIPRFVETDGYARSFSFAVDRANRSAESEHKLSSPLEVSLEWLRGKLLVCLYGGYERILVYSGNVWRAILNKLPHRVLYVLCHIAVPLYYVYRIPVIGRMGQAVCSVSMHPQWRRRVPDTFHWYSPRYQSAHTHLEVFSRFKEAGMVDVQVLKPSISFVGHKPTPVVESRPGAPSEEPVQAALLDA